GESLSSHTLTRRALRSFLFSRLDKTLSRLRNERFRTTSATWYTSPDFSFSRWFLNRRDQFDGMRASFFASTSRMSSTSSLLTGGRMPTPSALSNGDIILQYNCVTRET